MHFWNRALRPFRKVRTSELVKFMVTMSFFGTCLLVERLREQSWILAGLFCFTLLRFLWSAARELLHRRRLMVRHSVEQW
jgi:hypothetical protein